MKTELHHQWHQLRRQWNANPRLRILAAVVALILLFSLLQNLYQLQNKAQQESLRQLQRLQEVRQLSQEQHWQDYAVQAAQALERLEQQLWHAQSEGQAQAKLRDVLQQALTRNGLEASRVNITSLPAEEGSLLQVRAELSGDYLPGAWQEFVHDVTHQNTAILIEFDNINRTNKRRNHYRLGLHAWFVLGEDA